MVAEEDLVYRELTPEEKQMQKDFNWAINDPEVRREYPDQIVAVYKGVVLGAGKDDGEALASARKHERYPRDPAAEDWVITVPIVAGEIRIPQSQQHPATSD